MLIIWALELSELCRPGVASTHHIRVCHPSLY